MLCSSSSALQELLLLIRLSAGDGCLVETAAVRPGRRGFRPCALELQPVGLRSRRCDLRVETDEPTPAAKLAEHARLAEVARERQNRVRRVGDSVDVACEPRRLSPGRCDRSEAAELARGLGELRGFGEELRETRVAAARSHQCEHAECPDPWRGRRAVNPQHRLGRVGRLVPEPLVELEAGAQREQVELGQLEAPFLAVVESLPQVTAGLPIAAVEQGGGRENRQSLRDVTRKSRSARPLERSVDREHQQRVHRDRLVPHSLCEFEGARSPLGPFGDSASPMQLNASTRIRLRELTSRRKRFEQAHRLARPALRFLGPARAPEEVRKAAQHVTLTQPVPLGSVDLERMLERGDAFVVLVGQVAGVGLTLEERRALARRERVGEAKRPGVLRGRLPVRADRLRVLARRRARS